MCAYRPGRPCSSPLVEAETAHPCRARRHSLDQLAWLEERARWPWQGWAEPAMLAQNPGGSPAPERPEVPASQVAGFVQSYSWHRKPVRWQCQ